MCFSNFIYDISGFILIDKEKGYTSFDVCNKLKHKFKFKKVGHNGTLDPIATGLMIIGVNKATKSLFKLNNSTKEYITTIVFGKDSKTLDISGEIFNINRDIDIKVNELDDAIDILKSRDTQIPPMYSAIKINGKKLYQLARNGIEIDLKPRDVRIYDIARTTEIYEDEDGFKCVNITMNVSPGFYVRSFVRDIGQILQATCVLKDLKRTRNCDYKVEDAKKIDEVTLDDIFEINL